MTRTTKQAIIEQAEAAHARYPQYAGHWSGEEWKLVKVNRRIVSKLGVAFEVGDVTIARPDPYDERDNAGRLLWFAYSTRNNVDTAVRPEDLDIQERREVGRFVYDPETDTIEGPAAYMREQGNARLKAIAAGHDVVVSTGYARHGDMALAILVSLQTDYAGWVGAKSFRFPN
jgi:hypothetical protein